MFIVRLWHWISGFVVVRVEGQRIERFVNLLVSLGIYVWDIRRTATVLQAKISVANFRRLRPVARKSRCRVHIEHKGGLPFLLARLRYRTLLVAGAFAFVLALYLLTSFVWIVRVTGAESIDPAVVLAVARDSGLRPGVRKASLNIREIERNIVLSVQGLSWAKIKSQGTVYTIEVIEKAQKPPTDQSEGPCNVVAAKDGTIVSMLVLMGRAEVKEGARVSKGQVLVSGALLGPQQPLTPGSAGQGNAVPIKYVHARAIVKARVTYHVYREVGLTQTALVRTGRTMKGIGIRIGKTQVVWRLPFPAFVHCDVEAAPVANWLSRNTGSFVELHKVTYYETIPVTRTITRDQAISLAQRAATDAAHLAMQPGTEKATVNAKVEERPDSIAVTITLDVIEEIGVPQAIRTP